MNPCVTFGSFCTYVCKHTRTHSNSKVRGVKSEQTMRWFPEAVLITSEVPVSTYLLPGTRVKSPGGWDTWAPNQTHPPNQQGLTSLPCSTALLPRARSHDSVASAAFPGSPTTQPPREPYPSIEPALPFSKHTWRFHASSQDAPTGRNSSHHSTYQFCLSFKPPN